MKFFTIAELTKSATATAKLIDNTPTEAAKANLMALVDNVLDPLRQAWGAPIYVNSGYRCKALNTAVGGAANSGHLTGCAADITAGSTTSNKKLWELVVKLNLPFHKLIDEKGMQWLHISYTGVPSRIKYKTTDGKTYQLVE